jgi:predicted dinucleotide-binding enzyme
MNGTRIGVLGTGTMGRALAHLLARSGYEVGVGSRLPDRANEVARTIPNGWGGQYADVVRDSDVLFWAVAWDYAEETLRGLPDLSHAVLVDCSNPEAEDGRGLVIGRDTSGSEMIAGWRTDVRVIKAFNHAYAELLRKGPSFGAHQASLLYCGDDAAAKNLAAEIIGRCGFDPVDCGALKSARFLEPVAMLMVQLVRELGADPGDVALKLLRRDSAV